MAIVIEVVTNTIFANMKNNVRQDEFIPITRKIIATVLETLGMNAPKFAEAIGVNYQRVFDLQRGRTKKFSPNMVGLICERFPQINKSYLFTGEGPVLVSDENEKSDKAPESITRLEVSSDISNTEIGSLLHRVADMLGNVNERAAQLAEFERQLNEREASLNARELELDQREEELGVLEKKTV